MPKTLTGYERETIINFNKEEKIAYIFTYEKTWQKHLEGKLGLKPVMDNGFGGKEYELPKSRIKPPKPPKQLSKEAKENLSARLSKARQQKSNLSSKNHTVMRKAANKKQSEGEAIAIPV